MGSNNQKMTESSDNSSATTPNSVSNQVPNELGQMVKRVKDVLPQVPLSVIERDLKVTSNIDETITRILDGTVNYTPVSLNDNTPDTNSTVNDGNGSSSMTTKSNAINSNDDKISNDDLPDLNTAAKTFGKNANERTKSYQERKAALISNAKFRYCKKHNINI